MTPLPKRRISTRRQGKRRAVQKIKVMQPSRCPACGHSRLSHQTCPSCGRYGLAANEKSA